MPWVEINRKINDWRGRGRDIQDLRVSLNRGGSYIDSPKWLKTKKATTTPKNNDEKCFQHALTVALNYEQIKSHSERISNIKPFIDQYDWKEINFPSNIKDWNEFEKK